MEVLNGPISFGLAFLAGLLGSAHCIGMCGALVSGFFMRFGGDGRSPLPYAAYHGARILVYGLVGMVAAVLGVALVSTGMVGVTQGALQIVAGAFVVVLGLDMLGLLPRRLYSVRLLPFGLLQRWLAAATRRGPVLGAALGGALNGMMPCPLTFALAIKATTAATPVEGGLLMLAFGAGTLPSMLFVSAAFGWLGHRTRSTLVKAAAVTVVMLGIGTFTQGLSYFEVMRGLVQ
jgi:sulfite exporter TauE/SafE